MGNKQRGKNVKKDCLWQHLRRAWHFRQVFRHRQQARYTAKRSAGYRKKGRRTTVIHLLCRMYAANGS